MEWWASATVADDRAMSQWRLRLARGRMPTLQDPARASRSMRSGVRSMPIWKLEAALNCRSCKKGRYAPPVHMIKLTQSGRSRRTVWAHPDDDDRR